MRLRVVPGLLRPNNRQILAALPDSLASGASNGFYSVRECRPAGAFQSQEHAMQGVTKRIAAMARHLLLKTPTVMTLVTILTVGTVMASNYLSVGEAADELTHDLGQTVRPRWLTDLLYQRELRDDLCPIVGGRRLIPRSYLPMVAMALRRHGWIEQPTKRGDDPPQH